MRVRWIDLTDFRSYRSLRFEPVPETNVMVGDNAEGKTNVLEAIGYVASLRSFRSMPDEVLVRDDAERAVLRCEVDRSESSSLIEIEIPRRGRRRVQVNRQRLARLADMLGHLRVVAFLPDDLDIAKRGPAHRRDFIDALAVQLWPGAYVDQQEYERVLRQRNTLLREDGRYADANTLGVWNERLSQAGGRLMDRRARAIAAVTEAAAPAYRALAGNDDSVAVDYRSTWGSDAGTAVSVEERSARLWAALEENDRDDRERRTTTAGPHRDDPALTLAGRDVRTRASQGEQRSVMLALRLASHRAIEAVVGDSPVLLLDDVFSELDAHRAAALADALPTAQTFVTTARHEEVPMGGRRWAVSAGGVV